MRKGEFLQQVAERHRDEQSDWAIQNVSAETAWAYYERIVTWMFARDYGVDRDEVLQWVDTMQQRLTE